MSRLSIQIRHSCILHVKEFAQLIEKNCMCIYVCIWNVTWNVMCVRDSVKLGEGGDDWTSNFPLSRQPAVHAYQWCEMGLLWLAELFNGLENVSVGLPPEGSAGRVLTCWAFRSVHRSDRSCLWRGEACGGHRAARLRGTSGFVTTEEPHRSASSPATLAIKSGCR